MLCALAAVATICEPVIANIPPFARIAWAPKITLFTRDIMAYTDESGTRNVEMPADERDFAISCPLYLRTMSGGQYTQETRAGICTYEGAVSATMTVKLR